MRILLICFSVVGFCVSAGLGDGPTLQTVSTPEVAVPTKIAWLDADGTVIESMEYNGGLRGCNYDLVFDCFEPQTDGQGNSVPEPAPPVGFDTCGQEDGSNNESGGSRWYFGPTYCNPYISNDMEFDPPCAGLYINRLEVGWYWHVNGAGSGENCRIIIETFEDFDDTCQTGDPNGQGAWLGGVRLDFGYMYGDPGTYWYSDVDLCGLDWVQMPADGAGSYNIWLLTYDDGDPNTSYLCTCAQPMLWGTGTNEWPNIDCIGRGMGACPDGGFPPDGETSHQGPVHWDDTNPTDGWHTAPDECDDDYSLGVCPDPLGAMLCFYADGEDDDDGYDQSDLGELLSAWCSHPGDPNWNPNVDFDGDGHVGYGDLGILLADWG